MPDPSDTPAVAPVFPAGLTGLGPRLRALADWFEAHGVEITDVLSIDPEGSPWRADGAVDVHLRPRVTVELFRRLGGVVVDVRWPKDPGGTLHADVLVRGVLITGCGRESEWGGILPARETQP